MKKIRKILKKIFKNNKLRNIITNTLLILEENIYMYKDINDKKLMIIIGYGDRKEFAKSVAQNLQYILHDDKNED